MKSLTRFGAQASCLRVASILLAVLFVSSIGRAQQPKVTFRYDRFKDETHVKLEKTLVRGVNGETGLFLVMASVFTGQGPTGEEKILLSFFLQTPDAHFQSRFADRELIFLADGVRVKIGDMSVLDTKPGAEWIGIVTSADALLPLVDVKKIEGKVGDLEFNLSDAQTSAVHDFLKRLTPTQNSKPETRN